MNLTIRFDGGAAPNPGVGSCAYTIFDDDDNMTLHTTKWCMEGIHTNNEAEWEAVTMAVEMVTACHGDELKKLTIVGDSELVIRQIAGEYKVKNKKLLPYYSRVRKALAPLSCAVETVHVMRELNQDMDDLCKEARETA